MQQGIAEKEWTLEGVRRANTYALVADYLRDSADCDVIFRGSVDVIGIFNSAGYLKRINLGFAKRLGYSREELFSRPLTAFAHPEDRGYVQYMIDNIVRKGAMSGLCHRYLRRDGQVVFLEINARHLADCNDAILVARDITDQRKMEARNLALEESIALERMKTEFFSNLSHELKTPINILLSSAGLLKMKLRNNDDALYREQYERFLTYIEQNSFKLLRLINHLMECTRIDSGSMKLLMGSCQIAPFVRQVVETTESYAAAHKINIRFDTDVKEDFRLCCDQDKVDRILLNLISNSIKHTGEGGTIRVRLSETLDYVQISVEDDGEGIPDEMIPHIFERFKVYEEGFVKGCQGTGVGLSIVKGLAELHGGTVTVKSQWGRGTGFYVTLSKKLGQRPEAAGEEAANRRWNRKWDQGRNREQDEDLHRSLLQIEMSDI